MVKARQFVQRLHWSSWIALLFAIAILVYPNRPVRGSGQIGGQRCFPPIVLPLGGFEQNGDSANDFNNYSCSRSALPRFLGASYLVAVVAVVQLRRRTQGDTGSRVGPAAMLVLGAALVVGLSRPVWTSSDSPCGSLWFGESYGGLCGGLKASRFIEFLCVISGFVLLSVRSLREGPARVSDGVERAP